MNEDKFTYVHVFWTADMYAVDAYPPLQKARNSLTFEALPDWIREAVAVLDITVPDMVVPRVGHWFPLAPHNQKLYVLVRPKENPDA